MAKPLNPKYTLYHPKWHRRRMPIFWWLRRLAYARFISRELTSLLVGYSAVLLTVQIWTLVQGGDAYNRFSSWLQLPPVVVLNLAVLLGLLFHTITWLNLAPTALVVRLGRRRVPDAMVLAGHYLAWVIASGLVAWILLGR